MDSFFEIETDARKRLIRTVMGGFFGPEDVRKFGACYRAALAKLGPGEHLTLADIRGMSIQSQDIVQAFSAFMATPGIRSRKLAFVCGTSLSRLQAARLTDRDHVDFFADIADAEAWLLA